jgi:hypothetical protein
MANKALITRRAGERARPITVSALSDIEPSGLTVEAETPAGVIVRGTDRQYEALAAAGFRVKLLPDTNLLHIGRYTIDVETDAVPDVSRELDITAADVPGWPHHLVQLAGPPIDAWVREIEARGIDVVEPVSGYAVFVYATSDAVSALRDLPFVVWTGPLKPAYRIVASTAENVEYVSVGVYPSSETEAVRREIRVAQGRILDESRQPATYGGEYAILRVQGAAIDALARVRHVRWVEAVPRKELEGERELQIVAENLDGTAPPATAPVPGYQSWLSQVGVNGTDVTIAIVDSGVDANANNATAAAHVDLRGRQVAFVDYSAGAAVTDTVGHGTHVAGIALGNAASGQTEAAAPNNFLWGQGVAPGAQYVTQNALHGSVYPRPAFATLATDSARNGADVMNNSWGTGSSGGDGYVAECREVDLAVRDADASTAALQSLAVVFSAGNAGGRPRSITQPHECTNAIVVGSSLNSRPGQGFPSDDIRGIGGTSSRGPATDGRILPTIVAPGTNVPSALSRTATGVTFTPIPGTGTPDPANPGVTINQYTSQSGTSMAAPLVAGACAVIIEWWRNRTGGKTPSPAMLKALLVNSAENLAGGENWRALNAARVDRDAWIPHTTNVFRRELTFVPDALVEVETLLTQVADAASIVSPGQWAFETATNRIFVRMLNNANPGDIFGAPVLEARDSQPLAHIPNNDQGWGRLSLNNVLLQSPASDRGPGIYSDQKHAFTADGQELLIKVVPVDTSRPLRITLAWTDAAGSVGSILARVNDLDLEVTEVATARIFNGNNFQSGFSVSGGSSDIRNNVECVYIQQPSGVYEVRVIAASIVASANPAITTRWQDFALVIDNADVPDAAPVSVATVLDRSGSMIFFDFVDITRICTRQFIDLMGVSDQVGLVSFGDDARVEFPANGTSVTEITGQTVKDAAMNTVNAVTFGGCTAMGDGIASAASLLGAAPSPRAIVLFSDGYDNKGCAPPGSTRPTALQAAQALPGDVRLFSCAMGPASDQALLESIANATSGRYYFMPAIDELFEIYNYIRGQVSGTSIVVNQQGQASSSSVPAFIDAAARAATFTVAWADAGLRAVLGEPRKPHEVGVRLVDPRGRQVPTHASFVRRHVADTFIVFRVEDPAPGRWHLQIQTMEQTHVTYTAGVFVDSPLRLVIGTYPRRLKVGDVVNFGAVMLDAATPFLPGRASATISAPRLGLQQEIRRWRDALNEIEPPKIDGDTLPIDVARLAVLNQRLKKGEVFSRVSTTNRLSCDRFSWKKALPPGSAVKVSPNAAALTGRFVASQSGSYNVTVNVSGVTPSGLRFVRKDRLSVVIR